MFRDLDDTLTQILNDPAAPAELRAADVSFLMPDQDFSPGQATIDLYLYDVAENRELRDPVPIVEKVGDLFVRRRPPLRVDCTYMVTAWSTVTGPLRVAEEHRLLSQALQWLSRFPLIPDLYLQGSLVNPPFPHPTMTAQLNGTKDVGEFWNALGQPPRPSFNLVVTLAMALAVETPEGPPVVTKDMRLSLKDKPASEEQWFQIGGKVFETATPANLIAEAQVRLMERNQTVLTDAQGRFTFTELLAGSYTLQVSKAGFADQAKLIVVPTPSGGSLNAYDVGLAP